MFWCHSINGPTVKEARRTIKSPQVERFAGPRHEETFWCYCCGVEMQRNVTDGNMVVFHGGLLEHMATLRLNRSRPTDVRVKRRLWRRLLDLWGGRSGRGQAGVNQWLMGSGQGQD
ncbi:hypothetical protein CRUP_020298 [Coryphaenoides rupestris]|nr:hypothetical protein CRUP_020298 [Coryphaenoides rupestris]